MRTVQPCSRSVPTLLAALAASIPTGAVSAGEVIPCAELSVPPACIRVTPDATLEIEVTIVDCGGHAMPDTEVALVWSPACDGLVECETGLPPVVHHGITDPASTATFELAIGGCCTADDAVVVIAQPGDVVIARFDAVGSPDSDASGEVVLADFVRFQAGFLTQDACFDYADCDGHVGLQDFVSFQQLFLGACD